MGDERDPPIEPQDFMGGVTVVDIGDARVARGWTRRHHGSCPHTNIVYDIGERRVWCRDCEKDVEAFDAFKMLVEHHHRAQTRMDEREKKLDAAEKFRARLIATKNIEKAWRKRNMVPACPHCRNGLFPEDFKQGLTMLGKDYARARLDKGGKANG